MGIKDAYPVLKAHTSFPQIIELARLRGYVVAIDISIFLYKFILGSGESLWVNRFLALLNKLKGCGIKSVCIFDGAHPPIEKYEEQKRRREQNAKARTKLKDCIEMRDLLNTKYIPRVDYFSERDTPPTPIREFDDDIRNECQKLIGKHYKYKRLVENPNYQHGVGPKRHVLETEVDYTSVEEVIEVLGAIIANLNRQTVIITSDFKDVAMELVDILGLNAIEAYGEAEALCSYLAVHGDVDAVLTEDTDVLAYGTPVMLAFKDFKFERETKVWVTHLPSVLEEMGYTYEEWRDLCILLGCDYNDRCRAVLPGSKSGKYVSIGATKAVDCINKHRSIDQMAPSIEDIGVLLYERCREIFTVPPREEIPFTVAPNRPVDWKRMEKFMKAHPITVSIDDLKEVWEPEVGLVEE